MGENRDKLIQIRRDLVLFRERMDEALNTLDSLNVYQLTRYLRWLSLIMSDLLDWVDIQEVSKR